MPNVSRARALSRFLFLFVCLFQREGSCFSIHSLSLCLFIGELSPLKWRVSMYSFVDSCYFAVVVYMPVCVCPLLICLFGISPCASGVWLSLFRLQFSL